MIVSYFEGKKPTYFPVDFALWSGNAFIVVRSSMRGKFLLNWNWCYVSCLSRVLALAFIINIWTTTRCSRNLLSEIHSKLDIHSQISLCRLMWCEINKIPFKNIFNVTNNYFIECNMMQIAATWDVERETST